MVYLSVCLTLFRCPCSYCILSYVYKTQKNACTLVHLQIYVLYSFNISEYKAMLIQLLIYHINIYLIHVSMYVCVCVYNIYILCTRTHTKSTDKNTVKVPDR